MKLVKLKLIVIVTVTVFLSACGGGGGSNSATNQKTDYQLFQMVADISITTEDSGAWNLDNFSVTDDILDDDTAFDTMLAIEDAKP